MRMGVGFGTLSRRGQLGLPATCVYEELVARDRPVYWAVTGDGAAAALSCHPDVSRTPSTPRCPASPSRTATCAWPCPPA